MAMVQQIQHSSTSFMFHVDNDRENAAFNLTVVSVPLVVRNLPVVELCEIFEVYIF